MRGRKSDYRSDEAHGEEGRDADADPGVGPGERRHEDSEELVCETETDHMVELGDVRVVLRENSPHVFADEEVAVDQQQVLADAVGLRRLLHEHQRRRRENGVGGDGLVGEDRREEVRSLLHDAGACA